ncbi:hypothetical protein GCM10009868_41100 [Terrabacter aerolatus]|uniref:DNA binding HTH domain-containing protein n=1 Tax=Terrabacter aerolatus TaxID=422442 RepID=A0A512D617_9MICO|nr:hypothetical protein TAE01_37340 [Terrabacter aerolatus]
MRHPVDQGARQRLLEAQRAEANALRKVQAAARNCDAVRSRLAAADVKLLEAQRSLVRTSGAARAALLLGVEEATLRRGLRRTDDTTSRHPTSPSSSGHIDAEADD